MSGTAETDPEFEADSRGRGAALAAMVLLLIAASIVLLAGCWLRTDTPSLTEGATLSSADILAQFAIETEPPIRAESTARVVQQQVVIDYDDPLNLPPSELSFSTSAVGAPLAEEMAKLFRDDGFRGSVDVQRVPTEIAIEKICTGAIDLAQIDRSATTNELKVCVENGIDLVSLIVALDRIVVVGHPDNFWLGEISENEIAAVLAATSWNDVNDRWPRRQITKHFPEPESSDFTLIASVLSFADPVWADLQQLPQATYHRDAVDRLAAVAADPESVAFVTMADLRTSTVDFVVRAIGTDDALTADQYPIERTIQLSVAQSRLAESPEVATFAAYYLNRVESLATTFNLASPTSLSTTRRELVDRVRALVSQNDSESDDREFGIVTNEGPS